MQKIENPQKQDLNKTKTRRWEFELITSAIKKIIEKEQIGKLKVLEFGCGTCDGVSYLCQLGNLIETDVYRSSLLNLPSNVEFRIVDIHKTDFHNSEFDILVSNQVIEHLVDLPCALREMQRITADNGYFAFSIPTATWLVLTIPAKMYKKIENVLIRLRNSGKYLNSKKEKNYTSEKNIKKRKSILGKIYKKFGLGGHGCYPHFITCFKAFRVSNWRKVLISNGFDIIEETPLLLRGDSQFSLFPPSHFLTKTGFASTYLFICKKAEDIKHE